MWLHNCVAQKLVPPVAPESGPQAKVVAAKKEMVNNILVNSKEEVVNNKPDILLLFTKAPPH